ncbi:PREDICTED: uncharacterized protein LOC108561529 isoform X2 [Nicrophorus vespilloides]|nr:PREDICTED: uncharacterized protein LOC108561529 isoform X2 [Nicrophorus vespilloides]XP_017774992.1 PREDICTED: uncharacterized protein LOC108561529 isoform X2 [Nicrophorus vespilloides]XP_017774993.1 PREDICTED: uncharacterized protein LOC108561529 isoform X2 [Nicrophorus vespilloides]XP_017774994.1 PREDICTED: uncharacterized protein LOC108561529 isoform X2 [Nicrophorus vespilloides]
MSVENVDSGIHINFYRSEEESISIDENAAYISLDEALMLLAPPNSSDTDDEYITLYKFEEEPPKPKKVLKPAEPARILKEEINYAPPEKKRIARAISAAVALRPSNNNNNVTKVHKVETKPKTSVMMKKIYKAMRKRR